MAETQVRRKDWAAWVTVLAEFWLGAPAPAQPLQLASRLVSVEVKTVETSGEHGTVTYDLISRTVHGVVDPGDAVVGLAALPKNQQGLYDYASDFEIIAPPRVRRPTRPSMWTPRTAARRSPGAHWVALWRATASPTPACSGRRRFPAVFPKSAQGVGLIIMRDFARWLAGRTPQTKVTGGPFSPPP